MAESSNLPILLGRGMGSPLQEQKMENKPSYDGLLEKQSREEDVRRQFFRMRMAGLLTAMVVVLFGAWWLFGRTTSAPMFYGVKLGLSPANARDFFQLRGQGSWTTQSDPELTLLWEAKRKENSPSAARFEFHDGLLVAARFQSKTLEGPFQGRALENYQTAIVVRERDPQGIVKLTIISKGCPTHRAEVQRLLSGK
jgi:hypothetical protein